MLIFHSASPSYALCVAAIFCDIKSMPDIDKKLSASLVKDGFTFMPSAEMRLELEKYGSLSDWNQFSLSWNQLETDTYMADQGRYRKRRYAVFTGNNSIITRQPHQPHFQTLNYNPLNGGVERLFEPIVPEIGQCQSLKTILIFCCKFFGALSPLTQNWYIEAHQFRIEAKPNERGQPTPEGIHRDGRDFVLVLLINRQNIQSGMTTIHDLNKKLIGGFTLTSPLDVALVDDARVYHGVTPVTPLDPALPAYRDVLVITLKRNN